MRDVNDLIKLNELSALDEACKVHVPFMWGKYSGEFITPDMLPKLTQKFHEVFGWKLIAISPEHNVIFLIDYGYACFGNGWIGIYCKS